MTDIEIKLRYNPDDEVVELVVGDEVVGDSGKAEFESWVDAHNEAHPEKFADPEPTEEEKLRQQVADLEAALEVANAANTPDPDLPATEGSAEVDSQPEA